MSGMSVRRIAPLIAVAALFAVAAGVAQAADAKKPIDFSVHTDVAAVAPAAPQTTNWDARKGRWGLTLDLQQPNTRATTLNDVQAGAYYRITPSLRVGGAVAFGDQQVTPGASKLTPDEGKPRVQLGTVFKF
jgi:hypothetical protein